MPLTCFKIVAGFLALAAENVPNSVPDEDGKMVPFDTSGYAYCDPDNVILPSMAAPGGVRMAYTLDSDGLPIAQPDQKARDWFRENQAKVAAINALTSN